MVRIEVSRVVEAPRDFVYSRLFDYENLPKASTIVRSTKILSKEGNVQTVEEEGKLLGRKFKAIVKATFHPPEKLVEEFSGDATGTQVWTLTEVPQGTKITLVSDITPRGFFARLFGGLASAALQRLINEEAEALKMYLESAKFG